MEILQIAIIGLVAVVFIAVIKNQRPEMAIQISIITGVIIFFIIVGKLSAVIKLIENYANKVKIDTAYLGTLLKVIGIAYIAEFASEICRDAGESAIASKVELAGKVIIVVLAVPIITSLLDLIIRLMP